MPPRVATIEDFTALLDHESLGYWRGSEGDRLIVPCKVVGEEARLSITIQDELLHCQLPLPMTVAAGAGAAAALAVCRINKSLRLPGFFLDADAGRLSYRISIPIDAEGLPADSAVTLIGTCVGTVERHWQELLEAAKETAATDARRLRTGHPSLSAAAGSGFSFENISVMPPGAERIAEERAEEAEPGIEGEMWDLSRLAAALEAEGYACSLEDNGQRLDIAARIGEQPARLRVMWDEEAGVMCFILPVPLEVAPERREEALLHLGRVNAGLVLQGFVLDPDKRRVDYRATVPVAGRELPAPVILSMLQTCLGTVTGHLDALTEACRGPQAAFFAGPWAAARLLPVQAAPGLAEPPGDISWSAARALLWDQLGKGVLGSVEVEAEGPGTVRLRVLDGGAWRREPPEAFRQRLLEHGPHLLATQPIDLQAPGLDAALLDLGFGAPYEELLVERGLEVPLPSCTVPFRWLPADGSLLSLLERTMRGSANRALSGLQPGDLLAMGGPEEANPDRPDRWRICALDGEPVGVVLLGEVRPGGRAGLGFIGIVPEKRGQGLGRSLHAAALALLAEAGCRCYSDSTDVENRAMQSVFFLNGCRVAGDLRHFRFGKPAQGVALG